MLVSGRGAGGCESRGWSGHLDDGQDSHAPWRPHPYLLAMPCLKESPPHGRLRGDTSVPGVGLGTAHYCVLLVTVCVADAHCGAYAYAGTLVRRRRTSRYQQKCASTARVSTGDMGESQLGGGGNPLPEHERVMLSPGSWRWGAGDVASGDWLDGAALSSGGASPAALPASAVVPRR